MAAPKGKKTSRAKAKKSGEFTPTKTTWTLLTIWLTLIGIFLLIVIDQIYW